jgi:ATP-dependent RNA helicase RhlE
VRFQPLPTKARARKSANHTSRRRPHRLLGREMRLETNTPIAYWAQWSDSDWTSNEPRVRTPSTAFWLRTDSGSLYIFCLLTAQTARDVLSHPQAGWCVSRAGGFRILQIESNILTTYADCKLNGSFSAFELNESLLRSLAEEKYQTPTPIQAQTIPTVMSGRDVIGIAQTGTGKTAAFALPILHRLAADPRPATRRNCRVLVLSPTRELSGQILDNFRTYGRHLRVSATLAIGGVAIGKQVRALLSGVDILIATPGRVLDLVKSNALRLGEVDCLVLDEADRMLDMGFIHDIRKIVAKLPAARQTLMFSATMPRAIADLAAQMLREPVKIAVAPVASTAERVQQRIIRVDRPAKPSVLIDILRRETIDRALIFTRTKHGADKVARVLNRAAIAAEAIHGNKSQSQRERVLAAFRKGKVKTLVATDIAARGIDVDGISHVVNFDVQNLPETYVHRIGRTARAGADGVAISLCDGDEVAFIRDIEKLIRMSIPVSDRRAHHARAEERPVKIGNGRAAPDKSAKRRRRRDQASHKQRGRDESPKNAAGLGSVAFLNRHAPSGRDAAATAPRSAGQSEGS